MQSIKILHKNVQLSLFYRKCKKFIPKGFRSWLEQKFIYGIASDKYDFYMSLGENCLPARALKEVNLRKFSGPFDWIAKSDFEIRVSLVESNFKDALNYEDLSFDLNKRTDNRHQACSVTNLRTGFWYPHDFQNDTLECYQEIVEKYQRRQKRFYSLAQNSCGLLVYSDFGAGLLYSDYSKKIEDFFARIERLQSKLKMKQITLILVVKAAPNSEVDFVDLYEKNSNRILIQPVPYFDGAGDSLFDWHGIFLKRSLRIAADIA